MIYPNIFILNSGRCGSTSFIQACRHITNYSAAHESRIHLTGDQRLAYPAGHIEADNRLCWLLGRLDRLYGDDAFYVHLGRDTEAVINSFMRREQFGIMKAYREGILLNVDKKVTSREIASDYLDTVESNIRMFLENKSHQMSFSLEQAKTDFALFWQRVSAQGDYDRALAEWDIPHNASSTG